MERTLLILQLIILPIIINHLNGTFFEGDLNILNKNNCEAIAQRSGSINDNKIITYANKNKMSLYFIKNRLFKH